MNSNGRARTKVPDVAGSVSELTHDVIELSELQTKLLMLDIKRSSKRLRNCAILAVVAVCVFLGTLPVALMALAHLFVEQFQWTQSAAFGVAAAIGLGLTAIVAGIAWAIFNSGLMSLERSREEFRQNIDWLKSTLRSRGKSTTSQTS